MSLDLGLVMLRVLVGGLFIGHGAQKLWGWFGGHGLNGFAGWLESIGLRPARFWALLAGASEVGGGLLLVLGLLNPLGPLAIMGAMLMAIKVHWAQGLWVTNNGFEYPLVLLIVSAIMGLLGPGHLSLDALLGIQLPLALTFWGGLVGAIIVNAYAMVLSSRASSGKTRGRAA
jgi:putative oxidoreductase